MIAAQSIDGFIARKDAPGTDFCSGADRTFLKEALAGFDSMVMGRKTFDTLRERIEASRSRKFLRKIMTREPERYAQSEVPGSIEFTEATPQAIVQELESRGRTQCALLGGGEIYSAFLAARQVDALWLTVEATLFGTGTPIVSGAFDLSFELESTTQLGPTAALLKYRKL